MSALLENKILNTVGELDNSSLVPLHIQISDIIRFVIKIGNHEIGEKLPSERVMSEYYNVSRVTIRKAIEILVDEKVLTKNHGKGIFISEHYDFKLPNMHVGLLFRKNKVLEFHPMNVAYFEGIDSVLSKYGYSTEIITVEMESFNAENFKAMLKQKNINAIISFIAEADSNEMIEKVIDGMPLVNRILKNKNAAIDYFVITKNVMEYLYNKNHRNIAFTYALVTMENTRISLNTYRKSCRELGLNAYEYELKFFDLESGKKAVKDILGAHPEVTAIICADDYVAMGALSGLNELGKSCPEDISLIGNGNYDISRFTNPPLSTWAIPYYEVGKLLAKSLIDKKSHKSMTGILIERESVKNL